MSDHDATVRRFLYPGYISTSSGWKKAHDALDALIAERDHYRAALELLHSPTRRQDLDQGRRLTHYIGNVLLHVK